MENIFFLVLVAVIGLLRWLSQAAENKRNAEAEKRANPSAPNASPRPPAKTEEERIRRFMEALGVPASTSPPKIERRQQSQKKSQPSKRTIYPVDPFPKPRTSAWNPEPVVVAQAPPVVASPPPIPVAPDVVPVARTPDASFVFDVQIVDGKTVEEPLAHTGAAAAPSVVRQKAVAAKQTWAARLATPSALRDAIVLREVFGPPRSMQPFDRTTVG